MGTGNKKSSGDLATRPSCLSGADWCLFHFESPLILYNLLFSFWLLLPHSFTHDFPNSISQLMVLASAYIERHTSNSDAKSGIEEWVSCPWIRSPSRSYQVRTRKWPKHYQSTEAGMPVSGIDRESWTEHWDLRCLLIRFKAFSGSFLF